MFEKIKEIYDSGKLVAEIFSKDSFSFLVSKDKVSLKNSHYLNAKPEVKTHIDLREADFSTVSSTIEEWDKVKDSLWGRISHGSSMCGHTGTAYYPPNSKEEIYFKRDESTGEVPKPENLGKLEERIKHGDFEFIFERFRFSIGRNNQQAKFDAWQIPLIKESFIFYDARKGLYLPSKRVATFDDFYYGFYHRD